MGDERTGQRISELRKQRGVSQAQLVLPGLMSASLLSLIESGHRRASRAVLEHLAARLDTTVDYLTTGKEPVSWVELERRIAFAEMAQHHGSAEESLLEMDALLTQDVPPQLRSRARLARAKALESLGSMAPAIEAYESLWLAAEPGTTEWAERAVDVMRCYRLVADFGHAIDVGERALETFERLDLVWTDASIRLGVSLAVCHLRRGDVTRSRLLVERFVGLAEQHGTALSRGAAYWNASVTAYQTGRPADARRLVERAVAVFSEADHARNLAELHGLYGELLLHGEPSDPERARDVLTDATERLDQLAAPASRSAVRQDLSQACLRLGEPAEALRWAQEAYDLAANNPLEEAQSLLVLAEVLAAQGQTDAAADRLVTAEAALASVDAADAAARAWRRLAQQYGSLGDQNGELRALRAALAAAGYAEPRTQNLGSAFRSSR
ncbi:helix-turn-helix domain-containing protein [Micromonospora chersina]|uniref:helix-turn-helix domain-containing protein n=1 Tax=Micromonospora chersina TaxID=47854 RepID=UPI003689FE4F